jgi:hypothetical protein
MLRTIGPHFVDELTAAGLAGLPFSWQLEYDDATPDAAFTFGPAMTDQQKGGVRAVLAAHNPTDPVKIETNRDAARAQEFDGHKLLKAVVLWLRPKLNETRAALPTPLPPITAAEMRADVLAIYKGLL